MANNEMAQVGTWAFIIVVIIAVLAGLLGGAVPQLMAWGIPILVILGIIVGFVNVSMKEAQGFVLMTVAIIIVASLSGSYLATVPYIGNYSDAIFKNLMAFVTPASIIVALKSIAAMAKD